MVHASFEGPGVKDGAKACPHELLPHLSLEALEQEALLVLLLCHWVQLVTLDQRLPRLPLRTQQQHSNKTP
jgi:hypothetical protein